MSEMNDPFYTTPKFLGIASGGQVINDEARISVSYDKLSLHV